ncbi:MAG TPA: FHA domain-containing protein [Acidobacteriota bacterium]|nr:FHA domain-containing protein [Acidobacteriota bacterium]HNH83307.1 FHA domain-containing protein [Acidobacteriota bacterium]
MNNRRLTPRITPADWMATPPAIKELLNHFVELATEIELARTLANTPDDPSQTLIEVPAVGVGQGARLVLLAPKRKPEPVFQLERKEILIGRKDIQSGITPEIDLTDYDRATLVSRRQARIFVESGTFHIEDLGSANGTYIFGKRTAHLYRGQFQSLVSGDEILVGSVRLKFLMP